MAMESYRSSPLARKDGGPVAVSQDEFLVKPRRVADFPYGGIDDRQLGADKLIAVKALDQLQGAGVGVAHDGVEMGGGDGPCHGFPPMEPAP